MVLHGPMLDDRYSVDEQPCAGVRLTCKPKGKVKVDFGNLQGWPRLNQLGFGEGGEGILFLGVALSWQSSAIKQWAT